MLSEFTMQPLEDSLSTVDDYLSLEWFIWFDSQTQSDGTQQCGIPRSDNTKPFAMTSPVIVAIQHKVVTSVEHG